MSWGYRDANKRVLQPDNKLSKIDILKQLATPVHEIKSWEHKRYGKGGSGTIYLKSKKTKSKITRVIE